MQAKIAAVKACELLAIFACVSEVVKQCYLYIQGDRLTMKELNNTGTCCAHLQLTSSDSLAFQGNRDMTYFGIHTDILIEALKTGGKDHSVVITYEEESSDYIHLLFRKGSSSFELSIYSYELNHDVMNIADYDLDARVVMPSKRLKKTVNNLLKWGSTVKLAFEENTFICRSRGEKGKLTTRIVSQEDEETTVVLYSYLYPTRYDLHLLLKTLKACSLFPTVTLDFMAGKPLKLAYHSATTSDCVHFYLCPMIDEDE